MWDQEHKKGDWVCCNEVTIWTEYQVGCRKFVSPNWRHRLCVTSLSHLQGFPDALEQGVWQHKRTPCSKNSPSSQSTSQRLRRVGTGSETIITVTQTSAFAYSTKEYIPLWPFFLCRADTVPDFCQIKQIHYFFHTCFFRIRNMVKTLPLAGHARAMVELLILKSDRADSMIRCVGNPQDP